MLFDQISGVAVESLNSALNTISTCEAEKSWASYLMWATDEQGAKVVALAQKPGEKQAEAKAACVTQAKFSTFTTAMMQATQDVQKDMAIVVQFQAVAPRLPVKAQESPNRVIASRRMVEDRPFRMPGNFSGSSWKHMVIGVNPRANVYASSSSYFSEEDVRFMGARIQSELAKIKRFTIQDVEDADYSALRDAQEDGDIRIADRVDQPEITHFAQWNIKLSTVSERTGSYSKEIRVVCDLAFKLTEAATGNIVEDASLPPFDIREEQRLDNMGRVVSGINWRDASALRGIVQRLASQGAIRIANILANENPCGGKIVACLSEKAMVMENGTRQGISDGMQMLVYATVEGVPVPIAYADAQPGPDRTKLDLWKFNEDDPFAQTVIAALKANPKGFREHGLNAVSVGEAANPLWRNNVLGVFPEDD